MRTVARWAGIVAVVALAHEVLPMPAWKEITAVAGVFVALSVCHDVLAWRRRRRARRYGGETARPDAARAETGRDWQTVLEARVAQLRKETGLTAVAAAVAVDGRLAGIAAAGERRRRGGVPVTADDRWHVGSVTKSMTATLLAVLEDDGLLAADAPLPALLPDVEMADGWRACTLHHLLTHTAGARPTFHAVAGTSGPTLPRRSSPNGAAWSPACSPPRPSPRAANASRTPTSATPSRATSPRPSPTRPTRP